MTQLDLAGVWHLSDIGTDYSCPITFPGDGITALHAAGKIPDPYWGRNEYDVRWICERDWIATREFELTSNDVSLTLSRVDTVATIELNGVVIGETDNAFRTYRFDLSSAAKIGQNTLRITFHSSVEAGKALYDAHLFEIPWSTDNCPIPYGNFLRKPACDFGWDWNIALAPFGVYGDIKAEENAAPRIEGAHIRQDHSDQRVKLTVSVEVANFDEEVIFDFDGHAVSVGVENGKATAVIEVTDPSLWWPSGQGDQPLYGLTVTAGTAVEKRRIGLRTIELVTEADDIGLGFKFRVNGRDVFCKGANWIPADALQGRVTQDGVRDMLQSAKDANMNMIRIWGGGQYEPTWFYDLCDELGLMVWQDFMFACNLYPSDRVYLENVKAEVRDNVARLQHHACLAVWCGDNELIGALGWYDVSRKDRDRYLVNYDRLNRALEDTLFEVDPDAIWWPSSPSPGPMNFGDAWHDDGSGDMHFWSVWHENRDFDHYRDVGPRFCSEFGFQSYPTMNAIRRFSDPVDWNIASPVLESHQKNASAAGNARIAQTMFRYFRWPERFEDFVYLSQVQQGVAIKTAVTHWRSLKPRNMGTLIWQLNDTWPVCSWASLDHGGDWKVMHHMAKDFYADVIVTAVPMGDKIELRAVNDAPDSVELDVKLSAVSGTTARALSTQSLTVGTVAETVSSIAVSDLGAEEFLCIDWSYAGGSGREVYAPKPYKSYDLEDPNAKMAVNNAGETYDITVTSEGLALFTTVEADTEGRFSDNAFDMMPGETKILRFTLKDPSAQPNFSLRHLHNATYAKG
ncbi:beta-mannosidase [Cognatiyoonia sediminum]|uniref:beta-mannosidase n=1 Tax=Cognatiyoonia sediminum TaxID=1508389 RepID=A0A1M5RG87_9RHOB|nr:glycoside hydrolase family 2 protein [Cognatiyoonia sediminum]SHH25367.1 beta-mannosidase [Cognatiyoonia sediminum]